MMRDFKIVSAKEMVADLMSGMDKPAETQEPDVRKTCSTCGEWCYWDGEPWCGRQCEATEPGHSCERHIMRAGPRHDIGC